MKKKKTNAKVKKTIKKPNTAIYRSSVGVVPLNDRVLVRPIVEEMVKTASGIIIPDTVSKEKPEQGEVVAVGKKVNSELKVGDKIVFSRYGYDDVKVGDVEYYILKEENVLAIITK